VLTGAFFSTTEGFPHTLKVTYNIMIPYNDACNNSCWDNYCTTNGTDEYVQYCHYTKDYLWGRTPALVYDEIYRTLELCPFIIGSIKEKWVKLNFTISNNSSKEESDCNKLPCNWCDNTCLKEAIDSKNIIDYVFSIREPASPIDKALTTLTSTLHIFAIKEQKMNILDTTTEIFNGFAAPYHYLEKDILHIIRYTTFILSLFLIHVLILMLGYKFRKQLYAKIIFYNSNKVETSALLWSFLITTFFGFIAMLYMALHDSEMCISVFELLILVMSLIFVFPIIIIVMCRLKIQMDFFPKLPKNRCAYSCCYCVQFLIMVYLLFMPHILFFLIVLYVTNFFQNPLSYIILMMYFQLSIVIMWIANALAIYLVIPLIYCRKCYCCCSFKTKQDCRHLIFAIILMSGFNLFNFSIWSFVSVYFYDQRGNASTYLTLVPGISISLIGWYMSGNLFKLFELFQKKKTSFDMNSYSLIDQESMNIPINDEDDRPKRRRSSVLHDLIVQLRQMSFRDMDTNKNV
jgi:hypothetical protein